MKSLKTIQVAMYDDRIEFKGKETDSVYNIFPLANIKRNTYECMFSLMCHLAEYQRDGFELEFKNYTSPTKQNI